MKLIRKFINIIILCWGASLTFIHALPQIQKHALSPSENPVTESFAHSLNSLAPSSQVPEMKQTFYDLGAMLQGFVICQTSAKSPDADEAINAIQGLRARLYTPAQQNKVDSPLCTDLTTSGHAVTAICGPHGTYMRSMDAGKMANQIYRFCRAEVEGRWRLGGQYIFNNGTVPKGLVEVYNISDMEPKVGSDH